MAVVMRVIILVVMAMVLNSLAVCSLFNDVVSNSDHAELNDRMIPNNELEKMLKASIVV
jgi:hypothetical protein